jgi:hypothetical protein
MRPHSADRGEEVACRPYRLSKGVPRLARLHLPLLTAGAAGTGGWDVYKETRAGEVTLPAGLLRLTMSPRGPIRGALIDLRSPRLAPAR